MSDVDLDIAAFGKIGLRLEQGAEETRRARFKEKNPDAAKWFEEAEEKLMRLHRYVTVASTSGDAFEAREASVWIARNVESIIFHWTIGKKAYFDFVMRDCPPLEVFLDATVLRMIPDDEASEKS